MFFYFDGVRENQIDFWRGWSTSVDKMDTVGTDFRLLTMGIISAKLFQHKYEDIEGRSLIEQSGRDLIF